MSTLEFWLSEWSGGGFCSTACVVPPHPLTAHAWLVISHKIPYKRVNREHLHVLSQHTIWTWCLFAAFHVGYTSGTEQFWSKLWMRKHVSDLLRSNFPLQAESWKNSAYTTPLRRHALLVLVCKVSLTPVSNNESHSEVIEVLTRHEVLTLKL